MKRVIGMALALALVLVTAGAISAAPSATPATALPTVGSSPRGETRVAACRLVRKSYACLVNQQRCRMVTKCRPWQNCRLTPQGRVCTTTRKCWQVRECGLVRVRGTCWRDYRVCN